jgi:hypothetical protein
LTSHRNCTDFEAIVPSIRDNKLQRVCKTCFDALKKEEREKEKQKAVSSPRRSRFQTQEGHRRGTWVGPSLLDLNSLLDELTCDECNKEITFDTHFHCNICPNLSLCEACHSKGNAHQFSHTFSKVPQKVKGKCIGDID